MDVSVANVLLMRKRPASSFLGRCGFTSSEEDRSSSPVSAMLHDGPARKRICVESPLLVVSPPGSPSTSCGTPLASSDSDEVSTTTRVSPLPSLLSHCPVPSGSQSKVFAPQSDDSDVEDEAHRLVDDAEISLSASILLSMASDHSGTDSASHTPKKATAPSPSRSSVVVVTNTASSPSGAVMVVPGAPGSSAVVSTALASPSSALPSSSSSSMKRVHVAPSTVPFASARRHSSLEESMNHLSKKKRQRTSAEQLAVLERIFETDKMPNQQTRMRLAEQLCMSSRRVQIWFQNKRAKVKRMSLKDSDDGMPGNSSTGQREVSAASSDDFSYSEEEEEEVEETPLTSDVAPVPKKSTSALPIPTSLNNVVLPGGSCTKFDHPAYYQYGVNKENMSIHSYNVLPFVKMGFPLSA